MRKYTDLQIIQALRANRGMVYLAAQVVGCDPDTIHNRAKTSRFVAATIKHERGKVIDTAEQRLFNAIERDEPWAIRLCLTTIGKKRGYVERTEVINVGDDEITAAIKNELAGVAGGSQAPDAGTPSGDEPDEPDDGS